MDEKYQEKVNICIDICNIIAIVLGVIFILLSPKVGNNYISTLMGGIVIIDFSICVFRLGISVARNEFTKLQIVSLIVLFFITMLFLSIY